MRKPKTFYLALSLFFSVVLTNVSAQQALINVYGRQTQSLNGKWDAIIDLYDQGRKNKIYLNKKPETKIDFYDYHWR